MGSCHNGRGNDKPAALPQSTQPFQRPIQNASRLGLYQFFQIQSPLMFGNGGKGRAIPKS